MRPSRIRITDRPRSGHDPRKAWADRVSAGVTPDVRAETDPDTPEVARMYLYDPIDSWFGITASMFVEALESLGDVNDIHLHVNSPGGDVFDGLAILNSLRHHQAHVTAVVDGLAGSIASVIAVGADETVMAENSEMAIHDAWGVCVGPAADMRDTADLLDMQSENIAAIYAAKADTDAAEWRGLMQAETWFVGQEAVDAGLADSVSGGTSNRLASRPAARLLSPAVERFESTAIPSLAALVSGTS